MYRLPCYRVTIKALLCCYYYFSEKSEHQTSVTARKQQPELGAGDCQMIEIQQENEGSAEVPKEQDGEDDKGRMLRLVESSSNIGEVSDDVRTLSEGDNEDRLKISETTKEDNSVAEEANKVTSLNTDEDVQDAPSAMEIDASLTESSECRVARSSPGIDSSPRDHVHSLASRLVPEIELKDQDIPVGNADVKNEEPEKEHETGDVDACEDDGDYEVILDDDILDEESADAIAAACLEQLLGEVLDSALAKSTENVVDPAAENDACKETVSDDIEYISQTMSCDTYAAGDDAPNDSVMTGLTDSSLYIKEAVPCDSVFEELVSTEIDDRSICIVTDPTEVKFDGATSELNRIEASSSVSSSELGSLILNNDVAILPDPTMQRLDVQVLSNDRDREFQSNSAVEAGALDILQTSVDSWTNNCSVLVDSGGSQEPGVVEPMDVLLVQDTSANDGKF
jgi:hypothetical protein